MIYYIVCAFVIALFIILFFDSIIYDLRNEKKVITIVLSCFILSIIYKFSWGLLFWGMEYEDSFAFSFLAREFSNGIYTRSFLSEGILAGSLDNPQSMGQYGGHFITYSVFLSYFVKLFGFSPVVISCVTTLLSFFSLITLSLISTAHSKEWWIAPIIYCSVPIINVFSNTFLCEPFSSFIIVSFIYAIINKKNALFILTSFTLAILCKRENLILIIFPTILCIFQEKKFSSTSFIKKIIPFFVIIFVYFLFIQNVFSIEAFEASDIKSNTFSLQYMRLLLPVFLKAMFSINYYSIITYLLLIAIVSYILKNKKLNIAIYSLLALFVAYLILYTMHYRGYYFVTYSDVSIFDSFRYLNNFFPLLPILFVFLVGENMPKFKFHISIISFCLLVFSLIQTYNLRKSFNEQEYINRWQDVNTVLSYVKDNGENKSLLICSDILLYQNICSSSFSICDIRLYNRIKYNENISKFVIMRGSDDLEKRFNVELDTSRFKHIINLNNGSLYKIDEVQDYKSE